MSPRSPRLPFSLPDHPRIRRVHSFEELATTPLAGGVHALCWPRQLPGDFSEVVELLGAGDGIVAIDEAQLSALPATAQGRTAIDVLLEDQRLLRERDLDPALNCVHAYARDESSGPVPTDVFSFHVDRAPVEIDTWLCTYHGAPSEGLLHEEARRRVDLADVRAELLRRHGGRGEDDFREWLAERSFDLHYAPLEGAHPFSFGVGNLWRVATLWPGSPVPPFIHRAPLTLPGDPPRLLLIS